MNSEKPKKPRKKFVKPTAKEKEERIDFLVQLLAQRPGLTRFQVNRILAKRYNVGWQTAINYLRYAKEELRKRLDRPVEEIRSNAVNFYEAVITDSQHPIMARIKAQIALCKLLGLDSPQKVELSGPDGKPIQQEAEMKLYLDGMSVKELEETIRTLERT